MEFYQGLTILIVFSANIMEAITGFAGTMLAMPATMRLIGITDARIVLNIVALFVSFSIAISNRQAICWKEVKKISLIMLPGAAVGIILLALAPLPWLSVLYGFLILFIAIKNLLVSQMPPIPSWALTLIVLFAGIIHGMFLSGGALLVLYATSKKKKKGIIRATLAPVWLILNLALLLQDILEKNITASSLSLGIMCWPAVIFALYIGSKLHARISQQIFYKLTNLLLILSGLSLLIG